MTPKRKAYQYAFGFSLFILLVYCSIISMLRTSISFQRGLAGGQLRWQESHGNSILFKMTGDDSLNHAISTTIIPNSSTNTQKTLERNFISGQRVSNTSNLSSTITNHPGFEQILIKRVRTLEWEIQNLKAGLGAAGSSKPNKGTTANRDQLQLSAIQQQWNATQMKLARLEASLTALEAEIYNHVIINVNNNTSTKPPTTCRRPEFGKIGIFILYSNYSAYHHATNTMRCYAQSKGYPVFLVNAEDDPLGHRKCSEIKGIFFRKHCFASAYLKKVDWMLVTDADTAIVNPDHCIEEFINDKADIIHYERFYNGEIAAGNYIARNSPQAHQYLMSWAQYHNKLPPPPHFTGADNGAIHLLILAQVFPNLPQLERDCYAKLEKSFWPDYLKTYGEFVTCAKKAFHVNKPKRSEAKCNLMIYPRAQSWVRDTFLSNQRFWHKDFMAHGIKNEGPFEPAMLHRLLRFDRLMKWPVLPTEAPAECLSPDWSPSFTGPSAIFYTQNQMYSLLSTSAGGTETSEAKPYFATNFTLCWPNCQNVLDLPTQ